MSMSLSYHFILNGSDQLFFLIICIISTVSIWEIKEIRQSSLSKDFEKNGDFLKSIDINCCLVIFHGNTFNLKVISCIGMYYS